MSVFINTSCSKNTAETVTAAQVKTLSMTACDTAVPLLFNEVSNDFPYVTEGTFKNLCADSLNAVLIDKDLKVKEVYAESIISLTMCMNENVRPDDFDKTGFKQCMLNTDWKPLIFEVAETVQNKIKKE